MMITIILFLITIVKVLLHFCEQFPCRCNFNEQVHDNCGQVRQELLLEGIPCHSFLEGEEEPPYAVIGDRDN